MLFFSAVQYINTKECGLNTWLHDQWSERQSQWCIENPFGSLYISEYTVYCKKVLPVILNEYCKQLEGHDPSSLMCFKIAC